VMMRPRTRASTVRRVLLALAIGAAAGCGASATPIDTVVYASGADLESGNPLITIHPLARQVQRYMLFVTLAKYDSALEPEPYFARHWTWSVDRRSLTFSLAAGLAWQDGRPTTSRDVAFTIDAARDPRTGYPRYADLADITNVETPNDTTVTLHFGRAQPEFPLVLCELPIVPAHLLASVPRSDMRRAAFDTMPVGNGPFRFVERRPGERWVFARNDAFPAALGGPPNIRRFVVAIVDEPSTKFAGLVSGELDVAGISPAMAGLVRRDPSLRVLEYPEMVSYGIIFDVARPPFDDARVRRAVGLAIDRHRIAQAALYGFATPTAGPVPAEHPYAAPDTAVLDTARADSLLDQAGWHRTTTGFRWRAGVPLAFSLLTVGSGDNAVEQLLQSDMAAVGIRVEIRQRELASFLQAARARPPRFDALITGIPGDLSLAYLSAMYDSHQAGGALDYGDYHSPVLDSLLSAARDAPDAQQARRAWLAVQADLARNAPAVWIYDARGVQGVSRRLHGIQMDLRGELVTVHDWSIGARAAARP